MLALHPCEACKRTPPLKTSPLKTSPLKSSLRDSPEGPTAGSPDLRSWNLSLAAAIRAVGKPGFAAALEGVLGTLAPFQMMNGFAYSREGRAFDLCNEHVTGQRDIIVDRYLAGAFVLDPFYDAIRSDPAPRMIVMRAIAPDGFRKSEYYRQHYGATGISDEIGFVMPLAEGATGVLSLSRMGRAAAFTGGDLRRLAEAAPVVCGLGALHWFEHGRTGADTPPSGSPIAHPALTKRETEIVTFILKGHSSLSIAANLSLSLNTVKVHRQRIYSKLKISSQAELFHLFLT